MEVFPQFSYCSVLSTHADRSRVRPWKVTWLTWTVMRYAKNNPLKGALWLPRPLGFTHVFTLLSANHDRWKDAFIYPERWFSHHHFWLPSDVFQSMLSCDGSRCTCMRGPGTEAAASVTPGLCHGLITATVPSAPRRAPTGAQSVGEPFWRVQHLGWRSLFRTLLQPALPPEDPSRAEPSPALRDTNRHPVPPRSAPACHQNEASHPSGQRAAEALPSP